MIKQPPEEAQGQYVEHGNMWIAFMTLCRTFITQLALALAKHNMCDVYTMSCG